MYGKATNQELTGAEQLVLVSNLASGQSTRCVMKTSIFLALPFLALIFQVRPTKHLFARGEEVAADSAAQQNKLCTVQGEEMEVFASYLKEILQKNSWVSSGSGSLPSE
jgi:hypothetical protein